MSTNFSRWSDPANLAPGWAERAAFAARLIPEGLVIADIGCGAMDFERCARPGEYRPIDLFARDARTKVVDLNRETLPQDWLQGCDLVSLLGVFEYLPDPRPTLAAIAQAGCALLFSYHPADLTPAGGSRADWSSHFTSAAFEALLAEAGFELAKKAQFSDPQTLYLAFPRGRRPAWLNAESPAKPVLALAGFFARGNCGDEALLQCICEAMQDEFDFVISLDEHGAYRGYWDWHPYSQFRRTHQTDNALFDRLENAAGLLVGGGGLPLGFAANQVFSARAHGLPTALAGVDFIHGPESPMRRNPSHQKSFCGAARQYADLFDFRALRSQKSFDKARGAGLDYVHGADWALRLPTDLDPELVMDEKRVLLVLREYPLAAVGPEFLRDVLRLIESLEARGLAPSFLPFCPEDERFLGELGLDSRLPVVRTWWNPRRAKQWIACSGLTISLGRLHPLIFGAAAGARLAAVADPVTPPEKFSGLREKVLHICDEYGLAPFDSIAALIAGLDRAAPADAGKVAQSAARLDAMIAGLKQVFSARLRDA
jgi:hypothetical protein